MIEYNFDELTERRNTGSYKWDSSEDSDLIPLWVADMDFRTAPAVTEALRKRVESGIFGYVKVPESYYFSLRRWFRLRHGWTFLRDQVIYTSGVVPAISAIIKALTRHGDGVVVQTPAYNCFFSSVRNNECRIIENPLHRTETGEGFTYSMDFEDLERKIASEKPKLLILCNPHNPTGRVWRREELERLRDICLRGGVRVISDEIHCELTHPGYEFIPYMTVDPTTIACNSPSKAFNTAGLQIANIICRDEPTRQKIDRAININEVCDVNPFGVVGLQAAYNEGEDWLGALNDYLFSNYKFLRETLSSRMPELRICESESTYLSWIDIRSLGLTAGEVEKIAKEKMKVWVNAGDMYAGEGYIRINYACPRERLAEGLDRLCRAFDR